MGLPFWGDVNVPEEWFDPGVGSAWDTAYLAGVQVPGLCLVDGDGPGRKIDVKSGPGVDGATETVQGYEPAKFTLHVKMWTASQWERWQALVPALQPKPGKKATPPLDIAHPSPNVAGIKAVLVEKISLLKVSGQVGELTVTLLQWTQPKKAAVTTPKASNDFYQTDTEGKPANGIPKATPPSKQDSYLKATG